MKKIELLKEIENMKARSAWEIGVKKYAYELIEDLEIEDIPTDTQKLKNLLLNGADNWKQYSWGGSALICDCDIAERLCTQSELKKVKGGERKPNKCEEWLDVQTRALAQAASKIYRFSMN